MTLGTSKAITIGASGKIALVLFDGTAGQHISFSVSNSTIASGSITIYRPDGVQFAAGSTASNTFIDSQTFPLTGSYTIVVDPASTYTGGLTLTTYAVDDVTGSIDADGTTVPVTITTPGQNGRFTFSGTAGQLISAWTTSGTWVSCIYDQYYVSIVNPDGSTLVRVFQCGSGALIDQQTLPLTGIYTLMVDPVGANTGTATLRLYTFADVTGPITSDGTDVAVTIAAPGQNARFTFTGAAGQVVSTWVTSGTWVACSVDQYYLSIVSPDGSRLARVSQCGSSAFIDQKTLPVAGTYTLVLDPVGANTGSATIHLFTVVDVTGPIAADGTSAPVSISVPGQNARLTFTGVAGQVVSAWVTSGTWLACTVDQYYVSIVSPDGSTLARVSQCGSSAFIDQKTLPVGGTYTLVLDPVSANVGSATLRLYTVVDIAGPITANGSSVFFSIATPGQNALLTFDGTAGQVVTASVTSSWTGCVVDQFFLELWKPDGSKLASAFDCGGGASLNNKTLPASGVYTVRFNPVGANTGSATVTLRSP